MIVQRSGNQYSRDLRGVPQFKGSTSAYQQGDKVPRRCRLAKSEKRCSGLARFIIVKTRQEGKIFVSDRLVEPRGFTDEPWG